MYGAASAGDSGRGWRPGIHRRAIEAGRVAWGDGSAVPSRHAGHASGVGGVAGGDPIFGEITYHDYYDPRRTVRTRGHTLIVNCSSAPAFMDPSQSWRPRADTVLPPNHALAYHSPFELYDLGRDPWEQKDVAGDA